MIKTLQEDCKSLASALTQICTAGPGADVSTVLQTLPPNLVQVGHKVAGMYVVQWSGLCEGPEQ
jgi:hypothetical protein